MQRILLLLAASLCWGACNDGTGQALVSIAPTEHNFWNNRIRTVEEHRATLTNLSGRSITLESFIEEPEAGTPPGTFAIVPSPTCAAGTVLADEGRCSLTLQFNPQHVGAYSAVLRINFRREGSASTESAVIPVQGHGRLYCAR